jgi:quercetin dioxygenase-like cupin family protein
MNASIGKYWLCLPALLIVLVTPELALGEKTAAPPAGPNIIAGDSVHWVPMKAGAVKYRSKTFKLPTGTIRVVEFKKSAGGVHYKLGTEKELYVVDGSADVSIKDKTVTLSAGDAVNLPTGIVKSPAGDAQDTTLILFTVPNASKAPVGGAVFGKDAKQISPPPGPPKDGVPSAALTIKAYPFDGNSIRVVTLKTPGKTPLNSHDTDSILYLLSGKMRLTLGDETKLVQPGDAVREPAGVPSSWEVLEDSTFISTSGPSKVADAK